ncbi:MAG TPA: CvpA family protein [Gammaproteobacteria bacterium]|nr:CvpA family protein [Gammaproteobacteria bacterium]
MIWVDYGILAIVLISAFVSLLRGFVKEALSLTGWVLAFWISLSFAGNMAGLLESSVNSPSLRLIVAFAVLFGLTLMVTAVVNFFASRLVKVTGLTGTDRVLGMFFGMLRGTVLVAVLVLMAGLTSVPKETWWNQSALVPQFQTVALWLRGFLPPDVARNFSY